MLHLYGRSPLWERLALPSEDTRRRITLELATFKEIDLFQYLKDNHYPDLVKSKGNYATFDCYSDASGIYAELKCRRTHYPDLLIEKGKWDNLLSHANSKDLAPWYINSTPNGIYAFPILEESAPAWSNRMMPVTTDFANNKKIEKLVGFLDIADGIVLYADLWV